MIVVVVVVVVVVVITIVIIIIVMILIIIVIVVITVIVLVVIARQPVQSRYLCFGVEWATSSERKLQNLDIRHLHTANLRTKILDCRGLDSSRILSSRGGSLMSIGNFPEVLSQQILAGIILVGRLGVDDSRAFMYVRNSPSLQQPTFRKLTNNHWCSYSHVRRVLCFSLLSEM